MFIYGPNVRRTVGQHKQPALTASRPKMTDRVSMGFCRREGAQGILGRGGRGHRRELEAFAASEKGWRSWSIG